MVKDGIRMFTSRQKIYKKLSKKQLIHLIAEYQHALDMIDLSFTSLNNAEIGHTAFDDKLEKYLDINNMYADYDAKELSDEIDFRMGKFDVSEWRRRRGFQSYKEFDGQYWNLEDY